MFTSGYCYAFLPLDWDIIRWDFFHYAEPAKKNITHKLKFVIKTLSAWSQRIHSELNACTGNIKSNNLYSLFSIKWHVVCYYVVLVVVKQCIKWHDEVTPIWVPLLSI